MRVKVSDYIADFLVRKGIKQVFSVVGGGAMHLNDSLGHNTRLHTVYNHHEQASAMAAEGYARVNNDIAVLCVTSGPGAINALNGVVGAYQDSIPMLVLSGQAKSTLCIQSSGLNIRTIGGQEVDIVPAVQQNMVKYAEMVMKPQKIRCFLEKAYHIATSGRPGPCWLDIPIDIQGAYIETEALQEYHADEDMMLMPQAADIDINVILEKLSHAKRPVLYAGNGIRLSGGMSVFQELVEKLQIPVVTCWNSIDMMATDAPLYCGRGGNMGDRAGNFAVQNSDFLLCIGTRLSIYQVGWHVEKWAREAFTVVVDIDPVELKKKTMRADLTICADASEFMQKLLKALSKAKSNPREAWLKQCNTWKAKYPVVRQEQYAECGKANAYAFLDTLSRSLPANAITVVANGSASVMGSQAYYIKQGDRFIMNCAFSSMGYALPASIGVCQAAGKDVVCIEGDGSIMMNLQELQTVVTNKLPIKIFVINNNGYHQIRQTQDNIFHNGYVGMGPESGDLGFPDFSKLAPAFGIPYFAIHSNNELQNVIEKVLSCDGYALCEVFVSTAQKFEPKSATKRLADGTLISLPLEDMAPFLPREELAENMYVPMLSEEQ